MKRNNWSKTLCSLFTYLPQCSSEGISQRFLSVWFPRPEVTVVFSCLAETRSEVNTSWRCSRRTRGPPAHWGMSSENAARLIKISIIVSTVQRANAKTFCVDRPAWKEMSMCHTPWQLPSVVVRFSLLSPSFQPNGKRSSSGLLMRPVTRPLPSAPGFIFYLPFKSKEKVCVGYPAEIITPPVLRACVIS